MVGVLAVRLFRARTLEDDARDMLNAALSNNPDEVYSYSPPEERAALGLTREKFRAVWAKLIAPRLALYHVTGSITSELLGNSEGVARAPMECELNRRAYPLPCDVYAGDHQGTLPVLRFFLIQAWRLDYFGNHNVPADIPDTIQAEIQGLKRDRDFLQSLGLRAFYISPDRPLLEFDAWQQKMEQDYQREANKARSQA